MPASADAAVRSAYGRDYSVVLVSDCHTTTRNEVLGAELIIRHHNLILQRFAAVKPEAEIDFE